MNDRCNAQTDYQGDGPVSHKIRCDLTAGHHGQHELRNRSDRALVKSWDEPAPAETGPTTAHARDRIEHLVLSFPHGPGLVEVVDEILSASLPALSTEQLVDELGARAGRSLLEAFKAPRS